MGSHTTPYQDTSGILEPVWIHTEPYSKRPQFKKLVGNIETDVCIIGAGISGISTAYELVKRGHQVVLVEAREVLSGETGRTSGHLASDLDDGYVEIGKAHGKDGAVMAADSHNWALHRVGEISRELDIECEYRILPGYDLSKYEKSHPKHAEDIKSVVEDAHAAVQAGLKAHYEEGLTIKGWDGAIDQRDAVVFDEQATFHPTKYCLGVLKYLDAQPNFKCFTNTRILHIKEKGVKVLSVGSKHVEVTTEEGATITCANAVEATCIPLQRLAVIAQEEYYRTYCIAIRVPKGSVEDCLIYDSNDPYIYIRMTSCDDKDDYMVVGGEDHPVGQEDPRGRFENLEKWVRQRFTQAGAVDYKWSGQIIEPIDFMAYIGKNQGNDNVFVITGDSGNGLTHGVLAGRLIADEIDGKENKWAKLYSPKRTSSLVSQLPDLLKHDLQINSQYKRYGESDITDIEDLAPGTGGVLNKPGKTGKVAPTAVYKDEGGKVFAMTAVCPHLHAVVTWNGVEKSWDCPVHGSRFSAKGLCVMGPARENLTMVDPVTLKNID